MKRLFFSLFAGVFLLSGCGDPEASAKESLDAAKADWSAAQESLDPQERVRAYQAVIEDIQAIGEDYKETRVGGALAAGRSVDGVSVAVWLEALSGLGTDASKPFLETAPCLIVIFAQCFEELAQGGRRKNDYVSESVGIATGMLISALHHAGLATLTHTPSPMGFLRKILNRPRSERPGSV